MTVDPRTIIEGLEAASESHRTAMPGGRVAWRTWGEGRPVVLLHGGFGSWLHWIRNVEPLARERRVVAVDLPGLGDSDPPPEPVTPESLGGVLARGLAEVVGSPTQVDLVGFSFGALVAGQMAIALGNTVQSLTLVGASGLGLRRPPMDLVRREPGMDPAARDRAHRHNLLSLMLQRESGLDDLALWIHEENDRRARLRSRRMSLGDSLAKALSRVGARVHGIWGEHDATAGPYLEDREALLRQIRPEVRFHVIPGAGHWVQYEAAEEFNRVLEGFLEVD